MTGGVFLVRSRHADHGLNRCVSGLVSHHQPSAKDPFSMGISTSSDRAETLRGVIDGIAAAVSADGTNVAAVCRAAGSGGSTLATDIRIGRHEVLIDELPAPMLDLFSNPTPVSTRLVTD
jgi:hypothetical protein